MHLLSLENYLSSSVSKGAGASETTGKGGNEQKIMRVVRVPLTPHSPDPVRKKMEKGKFRNLPPLPLMTRAAQLSRVLSQ